jgi:hypothetical protein
MNVIAKNMYAQVDDEGNMFQLLHEIMDHKKDDTAIDIANGTETLANGNVKPKITTQGWQLLVLWKDKLTSWAKLKDLRNLIPLNLQNMQWQIRLQRSKHLNGGYLTLCVEEALKIDRQMGTDHWQRALNIEMSKVKVAWNARDDITPYDV